MLANSGDVILVAGKGHEPYQEIMGVKYHFDDREELKNALLLR
jgi:UDP-N-acetylmuramoyl-L-alanyl-D-glutamate--2,6-diaminopimelate ligase